VRRGRRRAVGGGRRGASENKGGQEKESERRARRRAFEWGCGLATAPRVRPRRRGGSAQEGRMGGATGEEKGPALREDRAGAGGQRQPLAGRPPHPAHVG